ncbi:hypothetical protein SCLCIDRAFT_1222662 [Scleroderma citrinum Foug A]|uniref:Uncharacterized protein n=1 Tax=Scleroderma citrinum Foug A TaxID=1036808 RepID=A0A0C2YVM6_9AGAM|nr:hypothetical protein SCLCIDRAFT_1222662 [Scleroderma citrinum Foug A]
MTLGIYFDASAVLDHDKKFSGVPFGELITKGSEMYGCRGCSANIIRNAGNWNVFEGLIYCISYRRLGIVLQSYRWTVYLIRSHAYYE